VRRRLDDDEEGHGEDGNDDDEVDVVFELTEVQMELVRHLLFSISAFRLRLAAQRHRALQEVRQCGHTRLV
jgi:hypothetical protein